MYDSTGTTNYGYDVDNRLTSVSAPGTYPVGYTYDGAGRRASLSFGGYGESYSYNNLGELGAIQDTELSQELVGYGYDPQGRVTDVYQPGNLLLDLDTTYTYDQNNRITSVTATRSGVPTPLLAATYQLDALGNPTSESYSDAANPQTVTMTYTYDLLHRVATSVTSPGGPTLDYGYDAVGNRTSVQNGNTLTTNVFNADNQQASSSTNTGQSASYIYDNDGNQIQKYDSTGQTTYTFNGLNELTQAQVPVPGSPQLHTTTGYSYSGDGLRVSKDPGYGATTYTWDVAGAVPLLLLDEALHDNPPTSDTYLWGQGSTLVEATPQSGVVAYPLADGLGSIRLTVGSSGAVLSSQTTDPFGQITAATGTPLTFGFSGQQTDAETGLQYLRARYYDPSSGRFLSQDPVAGLLPNPATLHKYVYALDDPLRYTDPTGTDPACGTITGSFLNDQIGGLTCGVGGAIAIGGGIAVGAAVGAAAVAGSDAGTVFSSKGGGSRGIDQRTFDEASKGLDRAQRRRLHDELDKIGQDLTPDEIIERRNELFPDQPYPGGWLGPAPSSSGAPPSCPSSGQNC